MQIKNLKISNFKSLKQIDLDVEKFFVLVGPNGSGKSNFTYALEFLKDVYSNGIETAITKHGGYENISFRRVKRSKSGISFSVKVELDKEDKKRLFLGNRRSALFSKYQMCIHHSFTIKTSKQTISASFDISKEDVVISVLDNGVEKQIVKITRKLDSVEIETYQDEKFVEIAKDLTEEINYFKKIDSQNYIKHELILNVFRFVPYFASVSRYISNWAIMQIASVSARSPGVPTPNPKLSNRGDNLPAVIEWMIRTREDDWKNVIGAMRQVLPSLERISTSYLHTKTIGLSFEESGIGKAWVIDDVSDGTVQALAILTSIFDVRNTGLIIEEPENSLHPWALRTIIDILRNISKNKTVILTTHSPILLDMLYPKEVFIVSKSNNETTITNIRKYIPEIEEEFLKGSLKISECLDMGLVPNAVPGGSL